MIGYEASLVTSLCPQLTRLILRNHTSPRTPTRALEKHWIRWFPPLKTGQPLKAAGGRGDSPPISYWLLQQDIDLTNTLFKRALKRNFVLYDVKNNSINVKSISFIIVTHILISLPLIRHMFKVKFAQLSMWQK